jgi:hypothetical protein
VSESNIKERKKMASHKENAQLIQITETVLRLYVLLAQYLDRCYDQTAREVLPESEFQTHLSQTQSQTAELLSTNKVVKVKVEGECERILNLGEACVERGQGEGFPSQLDKEREILRIKIQALSDLFAVFRSI